MAFTNRRDSLNGIASSQKPDKFVREMPMRKLELLIIGKLFPNFDVRLERPINIQMHSVSGDTIIARAPIDIVILDTTIKLAYPIEIKYKTDLFPKITTPNLNSGSDSWGIAQHEHTSAPN